MKRPFVVLRRTPARKQTASNSETAEPVDLNTTFTLEEEDEQDEAVKSQVDQSIPNMNKIERGVLEDSLKQILVRIEKVS